MRNLVIKIKLSKKLEGTMSENEKDDKSFEQEAENKKEIFVKYPENKKETAEPESVFDEIEKGKDIFVIKANPLCEISS